MQKTCGNENLLQSFTNPFCTLDMRSDATPVTAFLSLDILREACVDPALVGIISGKRVHVLYLQAYPAIKFSLLFFCISLNIKVPFYIKLMTNVCFHSVFLLSCRVRVKVEMIPARYFTLRFASKISKYILILLFYSYNNITIV